MAIYAVGDLQGCFDELARLVDTLRFDPQRDRLVFCGDLVNRGPKSLEILRYVRSLGTAAVTVLGNHDLHLLAVAHGGKQGRRDTLTEILAASDCDELLDWLIEQPLAWRDPGTGTVVIHAGLVPQWSVEQALSLASEAAAIIRGREGRRFFSRMYGDHPDRWDEKLRGLDRTRFIVNCLTRLRYCTEDGRLDLRPKGAPGSQPAPLMPWFTVPGRASRGTPIVFGHWSTVGQIAWPDEHVHGLDTGCVWGGQLTALELRSGRLVQVSGSEHRNPEGGGD
ncbi:MAG: symmetrical bis(5'-nucleosyl)-tetraphosphatase [Panacagrimonas sp.]